MKRGGFTLIEIILALGLLAALLGLLAMAVGVHLRVADAGTETVLQMLVSTLEGEPRQALERIAQNLVDRHKAYRYGRRRTENPSGWIVETLQVVFQAFFTHSSFEAILVDVVNRGGDADTTGAIVGMLAGASYGRDGIPKQWLKALDGEVRAACERQAQELLALAERLAKSPTPADGRDAQ